MKHCTLLQLIRAVCLLALAAICLQPSVVQAGVHVWAGGDYLWSKPGNWFSGGAPQVGEAAPVIIVLPPAGAKFSTNDIPGLKIDEIHITGSNYLLGTRNGAAFDFRGQVRAGNPMNGVFITNLTAKIHGPMILNHQVRFLGEGSTVFLNGALGGSGDFYLTGPSVEFTGTNANTFSGYIFHQRNELRLNKTNAVAVAGPIHIGLNHPNPDAVVVRHLRADQIVNTADVTVHADGLLNLNGFDDAIHDLFLYGGHVVSGAGTLFLGGNINALSSSNSAVIEGKLSLGIGQRGIYVEAGPSVENLHIKAAVSGIAGLTKTGEGLLTLSGNNTFSSTFDISEGPVLAQSGTALGGGLGHTIVETNGTLLLFSATYAGETLNVAGHGWQGLGAVHVLEGINATWQGPVILTSDATFLVLTNSQFGIDGVISGPGGLQLPGDGEVSLSGGSPNTHTGTNRVVRGRLRLDKAVNVPALAGALVVGAPSASTPLNAVAVFEQDNQLPAGAPVRIFNGGLAELGSTRQTFGPLALELAALIQVDSSGVLTLPATVTIDGNYLYEFHTNGNGTIHSGSVYGGGEVHLAQATTIDVGTTGGGGFMITCRVTGPGDASMIKTGPGRLNLGWVDVNSSYSGLTIIKDGALAVANAHSLGATSGGTIVTNQGQLLLQSSVQGEALVIATDEQNPPPFNFAADPLLVSGNPSATNTWAGPVTLFSSARVGVHTTNSFLEISGTITGPGGLHLRDDWNTLGGGYSVGFLRLSGVAPNTFSGVTLVDRGVVELAKSDGVIAIAGPLVIGDGTGAVSSAAIVLRGHEQIANTAAVSIDADGGLDLNNFEEFIGSLAGSGRVFCQSRTLTVGANDQDTVWSGGILGHGAETLLKLGFGTLQITSDNYYTGQTVVQGGTLDVRGTLPDSQVVVNNTGKLIGTGSIGRLKNFNGGHTSPGALVGVLHSGNAEFSNPGTFRVDLAGLPPAGGCDMLNVTGSVSVGGILQVVTTNHTTVGSGFTIINNDGIDAVTGTFNGLAEGAEFVANNQRFRISYTGGDGNDVVITRVNTAPQLTSLTATPFANEGGLVDIDGIINDPDATDSFTLIVNWGDGGADQTFTFPAGTTLFHIDHAYTDDKPGANASDSFTIGYTLTDSAGSPTLGNLNTVIGNVAPSFPNFGSIGLKSGEALATALTFTDPGSDTWTATVDYGDGTGVQPLAVSADKSLALNHTFPTNGIYIATVNVSDDDTGTASTTLQVVVGLELAIARRSATHATVTWPGEFTGFNLQTTPAPGSDANWTTVPAAPALLNGKWIVTVAATNAAGFFRLIASDAE